MVLTFKDKFLTIYFFIVFVLNAVMKKTKYNSKLSVLYLALIKLCVILKIGFLRNFKKHAS